MLRTAQLYDVMMISFVLYGFDQIVVSVLLILAFGAIVGNQAVTGGPRTENDDLLFRLNPVELFVTRRTKVEGWRSGSHNKDVASNELHEIRFGPRPLPPPHWMERMRGDLRRLFLPWLFLPHPHFGASRHVGTRFFSCSLSNGFVNVEKSAFAQLKSS